MGTQNLISETGILFSEPDRIAEAMTAPEVQKGCSQGRRAWPQNLMSETVLPSSAPDRIAEAMTAPEVQKEG